MKYSAVKNIIQLANDLGIDRNELVNEINNDNTDFEVDGYRFIAAEEIDEIQKEELKSDLYILGCFNARFIADNTNIPLKAVEALQKAGAFEELGEMMVDNIEEIQEEYSRLDGYGNHFAHYDHNEHETTLNDTDYYYFRVN